MAKQTIIVMSDSHGDSLIVEEIRDRYVGKVDAVFHNGDSELRPDSPLWEGIFEIQLSASALSSKQDGTAIQFFTPRKAG